MRLVKESLEPGHEAWKLGTVADVAGAGTRRGMPDGPGVLEKAATETRNRARGKAPAGWAVGKLGRVDTQYWNLWYGLRITSLVHLIYYSWIVAEMV